MIQITKKMKVLLSLLLALTLAAPASVVQASGTAGGAPPKVDYVFVDKSFVESGDTVHVTVALSGEAVQDAVLFIEGKNGTEQQLMCTVNEDGLLGFEETPQQEDSGSYKISRLLFSTGRGEEEILFEEIGIQASYSVDEVDGIGTLAEGTPILPEEDEAAQAVVAAADVNEEISEQVSETLERASGLQPMAVSALEAAPLTTSVAETRTASDGKIVVVLDPGHCSLHGGAYQNGIKEHIPVLEIAKYCKAELEKYKGVEVYLTRETEACPFPGSGNAINDIHERVKWAARLNADAYISIHLNSATNPAAKGAEVYYPDPSYASSAIVSDGAALSRDVLDQLVDLGLYDRGIKKHDFAVNVDAAKNGFPGIIVEHCFVNNPDEAEKYLSTPEKLKALGVADAAGIAKFFNLTETGTGAVEDEDEVIESAAVDVVKAKENLFGGSGKLDITGKERSKTSLMVADSVKKALGISRFDAVIVADGSNFPDGLTASQLSVALTAPVLLVTSTTEDQVKSYIANNLNKNGTIYIAGGTGAVSSTFESKVRGIATIRRFAGIDRYDTNIQMLKEAKSKGVVPDELIVVSGLDFADALSASALGRQILIVNQQLTSEQIQVLKGINYRKVTILGGTGAVSTQVENEVNSASGVKAQRVGGIGRVETSKMVTSGFYRGASSAVFVKADVFADGLSGGLLAYVTGSPILLTRTASDRAAYAQTITLGGVQSVATPVVPPKKNGWVTEGGKRYYYKDDVKLTGWISFGSDYYYLGSDGAMLTGWKYVEGTLYYFGDNGIRDDSASVSQLYKIEGASTVTIDQMVRFYNNYCSVNGISYPSYYKTKKTDAPTIRDFCTIYYEEARAEGIAVEVAFCQAMKETGLLQFGGDVTIDQFNFAGIGTTGGGVKGAYFASVRLGVRAQIQHLKAYGSTAPLKGTCVDPRFNLVRRGSAPYVEWLGSRENPHGAGWATASSYGRSIVSMIGSLKKM